MFKHASNQALLQNVSSYCMIIECDNRWISAVVIAGSFAASALHSVPDASERMVWNFNNLSCKQWIVGFLEPLNKDQNYQYIWGTPLILRDEQGELHSAHVHGSSAISDYIVFKKDEGLFKSVPELMSPQLIDKYLVMVSKLTLPIYSDYL